MQVGATERYSAAACALLVLLAAAPARASDVGPGAGARPALRRVGVPETSRAGAAAAALTVSGGVTEPLSDTDSAHGRAAASAGRQHAQLERDGMNERAARTVSGCLAWTVLRSSTIASGSGRACLVGRAARRLRLSAATGAGILTETAAVQVAALRRARVAATSPRQGFVADAARQRRQRHSGVRCGSIWAR